MKLLPIKAPFTVVRHQLAFNGDRLPLVSERLGGKNPALSVALEPEVERGCPAALVSLGVLSAVSSKVTQVTQYRSFFSAIAPDLFGESKYDQQNRIHYYARTKAVVLRYNATPKPWFR